MKKYIALLRGINVGGKNKVPMPDLRALFEKNGLSNTSTYINSGNIFFSSDEANKTKLKEKCETLIKKKFGFDVPVIVIPVEELQDALDHAPKWWGDDEKARHNAIFVIPPVTGEEAYRQIGEIKPEYEQAAYYENVIFWSAPIKTFSRTRYAKIVGTALYKNVTIRNANTAKKLAKLAKEIQ